jgi:hypothetical protein
MTKNEASEGGSDLKTAAEYIELLMGLRDACDKAIKAIEDNDEVKLLEAWMEIQHIDDKREQYGHDHR